MGHALSPTSFVVSQAAAQASAKKSPAPKKVSTLPVLNVSPLCLHSVASSPRGGPWDPTGRPHQLTPLLLLEQLDTLSSILRSPRSKASPAAATAAADDEDDDIDAYLEWEEEVNEMTTSELKDALVVSIPSSLDPPWSWQGAGRITAVTLSGCVGRPVS